MNTCISDATQHRNTNTDEPTQYNAGQAVEPEFRTGGIGRNLAWIDYSNLYRTIPTGVGNFNFVFYYINEDIPGGIGNSCSHLRISVLCRNFYEHCIWWRAHCQSIFELFDGKIVVEFLSTFIQYDCGGGYVNIARNGSLRETSPLA